MIVRTWGVRVASGAVGIATLLVAWAAADALRSPSLPDAPELAPVRLESLRAGIVHPTADIDATVENDVFSARRTPSSSPYQLPGESTPADAPEVEPVKPIVLGTAVATDGRHFATVQLGDASPILVHVGDRIGDWLVRRIERGKIGLVTARGLRADVTVPTPGT